MLGDYINHHLQRRGSRNGTTSELLCRMLKRNVLAFRSCLAYVRCPQTLCVAIAGGFQEKCHSSQQAMRFDIWHQSIIKTTPAAERLCLSRDFQAEKVMFKIRKAKTYFFSLQTIKCSKEKKKTVNCTNTCKKKLL